jgi:hypothetical protein
MKVAVMIIYICRRYNSRALIIALSDCASGSLIALIIIVIIVTTILDLKFVLAENRIVYHY